MINLVVSVRVVPEERERFLEAIGANAASSVRDEPGCFFFEVSENVEEPNNFFFYEQYRDEAAIQQHRASPHYGVWRRAADACLVPGSQVVHRAKVLYREPAGR